VSDHQTNARLFYVADTESMEKVIALGDEIVLSVLLMRVPGVQQGLIAETHQEWFDRLLKKAKGLVHD
jgi:hypothetical protein